MEDRDILLLVKSLIKYYVICVPIVPLSGFTLPIRSFVFSTVSPMLTAWQIISTPVSVPSLAPMSTAWPWESAASPLSPSQSETSAGAFVTRETHA